MKGQSASFGTAAGGTLALKQVPKGKLAKKLKGGGKAGRDRGRHVHPHGRQWRHEVGEAEAGEEEGLAGRWSPPSYRAPLDTAEGTADFRLEPSPKLQEIAGAASERISDSPTPVNRSPVWLWIDCQTPRAASDEKRRFAWKAALASVLERSADTADRQAWSVLFAVAQSALF